MSSQGSNTGASDWLGSLKKHPEGLLLIGAGLALMLRSSSLLGQTTAMARSAGAQLGAGGGNDPFTRAAEGVKQYAGEAKDYASEVAGRTKEAVTSYASSAADYVGDASRAAGQQSGQAFEQVRSTTQSAIDRVLQEQPLVIALAGLAAGVAVAAAFPATDAEKQTLGPVGEQVQEAAQRIGEQLKDAAGQAGEKLKDVAEQRGFSSDGLKEAAKEVADAFTGSMNGGSQQAGDGSQQGSGSGGAQAQDARKPRS